MSDRYYSYHESLFQWIWEHLEFDQHHLHTTCGKPVVIADPGTLNRGAGPDFFQAHLIIDGLHWHGSVEIHKRAAGWNHHRHQYDKNFNNVILHVVYSAGNEPTTLRQDGTRPFTLSLKPYLSKSLNQLLSFKSLRSTLPCSQNISFINQQAFEKQIRRVHKEYFNHKVDELLQEFNPHLPLSVAWKESLIIRLYNALGIPSNRDQMESLVRQLLSGEISHTSLKEFIRYAEQTAASPLRDGCSIEWVRSGMRPASRPTARIPQAAAFHYRIHQLPFDQFFRSGVDSWQTLVSSIPADLRPGTSRLSLLRNTVFLPSIYLLGDLFHSKELIRQAYGNWDNSSQHVPEEVLTPFQRAGYKIPSPGQKLGLAHQYKRYCLKRNCHRCEVFKSAIRS